MTTTLYYVRLKTHDSQYLFAPPSADALPDQSEKAAALAKIVADELLQAVLTHRGIQIEQWVLEPDSLHAIVALSEDRPAQSAKGKPRLLTTFVAGLKAATAKRINLMRNEPGCSVWQRSYKEQRVEDDLMLSRLCKKLDDAENVVISS